MNEGWNVRRHMIAGRFTAPLRERRKNMFKMPGSGAYVPPPQMPQVAAAAAPLPTPEVPTPIMPPTMPDPFGPEAMEARRKALQGATERAGRSSTILTTMASRGGGTLASGYAGKTLGGA